MQSSRQIDDTQNGVAGLVVRFASGRVLFREGGCADGVFRVVKGVIRTFKFQGDGRRQICAFQTRGDAFGFEAGAEYSLSAEAISDCTVVSYGRARLEKLARNDERLASLLFAYAVEGLKRAQAHSFLLGRRSAVAKLAAFLIESAERSTERCDLTLVMPRQDIADYLALTIETVSRTFTQFEREALIELPTARRVHLKDLSRLHDLDS